MKNAIKISIITVTYNCAKTLPDCLASIAKQTYEYREHIIIDGASTDDTLNIINQHIDKITIFKSEPDQGIYDALNKGIQLCTGDIVGFLHADDFYTSESTLSKIAQAFEDSNICGVYGDMEYVSQKDPSMVIRHWKSEPFEKQSLGLGWMPAHPTLYIRREWYQKIAGFDIRYKIAADYMSILKLFSQPNFKTLYIPNVLVKMRLGGSSNKSIKSIICKTKEDWHVLRNCNFNLVNALKAIICKNIRKLSQFI